MTRAIILAAGRGSRLGGLTDDRPKGLVELNGRTLLDWQCGSLRAAGISDVRAVVGYRPEEIEASGLPTKRNPNWSSTHMVATLLCAEAWIDRPVIVCYSDILYGAEAVRRLTESGRDLAVTYDADWLRLWKARFDDPLADAESFRIDDEGRIREIGGRVADLSEIRGQYMGLIRLTPVSLGWIREMVGAEPGLRDRLDMTGLLGRLIGAGRPVHGVRTEGNWCEIDSPGDLELAKSMMADGRLLIP